jgi:hypothetical protein
MINETRGPAFYVKPTTPLNPQSDGPKSLSHKISLEAAHRKGLYPYCEKMPTSEYEQEKLKLSDLKNRCQKRVRKAGWKSMVLN